VTSRVCVFCGSNVGASDRFADTARELGVALARRGLGVVYGGGRVGLMGILADAALGAGGEVVGVMPRHLAAREVGHRSLTRLEIVDSMHARKARMAELADGVIALPGGFGTFEEVIEMLTWNQLGLVATPVVFLDVDGFYAPLLDFFDAAVDAGFLRSSHRSIARHAGDVEEAIALVTAPVAVVEHKWIDLDRA
jgi:uncharacterized protein (TIGR00730 family)